MHVYGLGWVLCYKGQVGRAATDTMDWKVQIMGQSAAENTCNTWSPAALGCLGSYCPILQMGKLRLRSQSTYSQAPPKICPAPVTALVGLGRAGPHSTTSHTLNVVNPTPQHYQLPTPQGSPQSLRGSSDQSRQSLMELHTLSREMHLAAVALELVGPSSKESLWEPQRRVRCFQLTGGGLVLFINMIIYARIDTNVFGGKTE